MFRVPQIKNILINKTEYLIFNSVQINKFFFFGNNQYNKLFFVTGEPKFYYTRICINCKLRSGEFLF